MLGRGMQIICLASVVYSVKKLGNAYGKTLTVYCAATGPSIKMTVLIRWQLEWVVTGLGRNRTNSTRAHSSVI